MDENKIRDLEKDHRELKESHDNLRYEMASLKSRLDRVEDHYRGIMITLTTIKDQVDKLIVDKAILNDRETRDKVMKAGISTLVNIGSNLVVILGTLKALGVF